MLTPGSPCQFNQSSNSRGIGIGSGINAQRVFPVYAHGIGPQVIVVGSNDYIFFPQQRIISGNDSHHIAGIQCILCLLVNKGEILVTFGIEQFKTLAGKLTGNIGSCVGLPLRAGLPSHVFIGSQLFYVRSECTFKRILSLHGGKTQDHCNEDSKNFHCFL